MFIKKFKPTSPAIRHSKIIASDNLPILKNKIKYKRLYTNFKGRNLYNRGGNKPSLGRHELVRGLEFMCSATKVTAMYEVDRFKYFIAIVSTGSGLKYGIKAPHGDLIFHSIEQGNFGSNWRSEYKLGERDFLKNFPTGGLCYSLRLLSHADWVMAESAGTFCKVLWHRAEDSHTAINTPAKQFVKVNFFNTANFGRVSNPNANKTVYGSFGKSKKNHRYRISVRGIAMNPVDHPNGGRTNTKRPLKNPWNRPAKSGK